MSDSFKVPVPVNEPIKDYTPNSIEKKELLDTYINFHITNMRTMF